MSERKAIVVSHHRYIRAGEFEREVLSRLELNPQRAVLWLPVPIVVIVPTYASPKPFIWVFDREPRGVLPWKVETLNSDPPRVTVMLFVPAGWITWGKITQQELAEMLAETPETANIWTPIERQTQEVSDAI